STHKVLLLQVIVSTCVNFALSQKECCSILKINTKGPSNETQSIRLGIYHREGEFSGKPAYVHSQRTERLFYISGRARGLWMVGPELGRFSGGLANRGDTQCPEDILRPWKYADISGWKTDPDLTIECHQLENECLYADNTALMGGDLRVDSDGKPIPTIVTGTTRCIDLCNRTPECQYWVISKQGQKSQCILKKWKGRLVKKEGYVSGSLPKACFSVNKRPRNDDGPVEVHQIESDETGASSSNQTGYKGHSECIYENLQFSGGNLKTINDTTFSSCKNACEFLPDCTFFSLKAGQCLLKSEHVEIERELGVLSGMTDEACEQVLAVKEASSKSKKTEENGLDEQEGHKYEPLYQENVINGKFKIMNSWDDALNNPGSDAFKDLAKTITRGLEEILLSNDELSNHVDFKVEIIGFKKGSVICNYNIHYILKQGFVAVPFIIKPSNVTSVLNEGFQFKQGILFQRFVIAAGSHKAASPVDHCDAKGCSHKCAYDYDLEDYVCTCPPKLQLGEDIKTCEDPTAISTIRPEVTCSWSTWEEWSDCSSQCGEGTRTRYRSSLVEENCSGKNNEVRKCLLMACPTSKEPRYDSTFQPTVTTQRTVFQEASTTANDAFDTTTDQTTIDMTLDDTMIITDKSTKPSQNFIPRIDFQEQSQSDSTTTQDVPLTEMSTIAFTTSLSTETEPGTEISFSTESSVF
ncbi:hypothetical protein TCAL_09878, partial [Tigriopus californicus]